MPTSFKGYKETLMGYQGVIMVMEYQQAFTHRKPHEHRVHLALLPNQQQE